MRFFFCFWSKTLHCNPFFVRKNRVNLCLILIFFVAYFLFAFWNLKMTREKSKNQSNCNNLVIRYNVTNYYYTKYVYKRGANESWNETHVKFPHVFDLMPHLKNSINIIKPRFELSKNRTAKLVVGIPTVKRERVSYLSITLDSLFNALTDTEKNDLVIVVFIAEIFDEAFCNNTIRSLLRQYKAEIDSGILNILMAPLDYYPPLEDKEFLKDDVFHDPPERIKWRIKQNFDVSYLMAYSIEKGDFYLQLEDDVISRSGFLSEIKKKISTSMKTGWKVIEFCDLGFIGKLFRTSDLPFFVNFFLMFASYKPVDILHDIVLTTIACDTSKAWLKCRDNLQKVKMKHTPSLFQHIGERSSLKGKFQKLKDKNFQEKLFFVDHKNPPAKLSTSLKTYLNHSLDKAYYGKYFFWSLNPNESDFVEFEFEKPFRLKKYYIKSGNYMHPYDLIPVNSSIEVKPVKVFTQESLKASSYTEIKPDGFIQVGCFEFEHGSASGLVDSGFLGDIKNFRIVISKAVENWIVINEISME